MKPCRVLFGLLVGLLTLGVAQVSPAHGQTTSQNFPTTFFVFPDFNFGPCPTETIVATGVTHVVMTVVPGGVEFRVDSFHGAGQGQTTGTSYQISNIMNASGSGNTLTGPGEATFPIDLLAISAGPSPNLVFHSLFHITVDANGNVTSFIDVASTECRG